LQTITKDDHACSQDWHWDFRLQYRDFSCFLTPVHTQKSDNLFTVIWATHGEHKVGEKNPQVFQAFSRAISYTFP